MCVGMRECDLIKSSLIEIGNAKYRIEDNKALLEYYIFSL